MASLAPSAKLIPPNDTVEFASLLLAMLPASMPFVTVPLSPVPINVPVAAGRVSVTLPENALCAGACSLA